MKLKQLLRDIGLRVGLDIQLSAKTAPLDYSAKEIKNPLLAVYTSTGRDIIFRVPLRRCRLGTTLAWIPVLGSYAPFIRVLEDYKSGRCLEYQGSVLEQFYSCAPLSAGELLGVDTLACMKFYYSSPYGRIIPWREIEKEKQRVAAFNKRMLLENAQYGGNFGGSEGESSFGPVSKRKGELEFRRLQALYNKIKNEGYRPERYGHIRGVLMVSNSDWRVLIRGGQHRTAVLGALDYEFIDVQISPTLGDGVVCREHAANWPGVTAGLFTEQQAVTVFDNIWNGHQPTFVNPYIEKYNARIKRS